jgi:parallel beta-helix repeat protein
LTISACAWQTKRMNKSSLSPETRRGRSGAYNTGRADWHWRWADRESHCRTRQKFGFAAGTLYARVLKVITALLAAYLGSWLAGATTYCVDPTIGSMSNPGNSASPWSTLEAVFAANKTFAPGDVIQLRSGYHGLPQIRGTNTGVVTIVPAVGAHPQLRRLTVKSAARWVVFGLDVCPANAGPGTYDPNVKLVDIQNTCDCITIRNCSIRGAPSIAGWTQADWTNRLGSGTALSIAAPNTMVFLNDLRNLSFGIQALKTATNSVVSRNCIRDYYNDGIRGLADFCTFEYNTVMNQYVSDANHDDCFQSWSTGPTGTVGEGTVRNVTLRGNLFLSHTDPGQPLQAPVQGIGCFDGMFENWVIENNVISSATYHGIALYGAINCRIVNNTVIENPVDGSSSIKPWIMITEHKNQANGDPWSVLSSGNLIRNNIGAAAANLTATGGIKDHNLTTTAYAGLFVDYTNFNFSLLPSAPAVNAGDDSGAPLTDIARRARSAPCDLGAYEYGATPATNLNYASWQSDWFLHDVPAGAPAAMPFQDGLPNLLKYLFHLNPLFPLRAEDYGALLKAGFETTAGIRYLTWCFRAGASAPDVQFEVQSCSDLSACDWQVLNPEAIQVLSRDPATGDQTLSLKFNASNAAREFLRLKVSLP